MNSSAGFTFKSNKIIKIAVIAAVLIFIYCQYLKFSYSPDDTFIYLKYSKNISEGYNFSFNKGEPSYGVTGPLWALILTIPFILGLDPFWFAKTLDMVFILISFIIFYKFTKFFFGENIIYRLSALLIFMLNPLIIRSTFTGMETSFAVFTVLLIFYLYYSKRIYISFFLMGFGMLIRPEIFVLITILWFMFAFGNYSRKQGFLKTLKYPVCVLSIVLPFWIFAYYTFGTIVSNTSLGKSALKFDLINQFTNAKEIFRLFLLFGPAEVFLFIIGAVFLMFRKNIYLLPLIFWVSGLLVLYFLSSTAVMSRYIVIIYPFTIIIGIKFVEDFLSFKIAAVTAFLIIYLFYSQFVFHRYVKPYTAGFTAGINECLIPAGKWLESNVPAGSRVLVNDVGAIGFNTNRYIIDAAALINRDLELNRKILSVPNYEKENPHLMLNFIKTDYLIEKDTVLNFTKRITQDFELIPLQSFTFLRMWVLDPRPQYFIIFKVNRLRN